MKKQRRFWQILMILTALTINAAAAQEIFGQQIKNAEEDAVRTAFDQMRSMGTEDQNRIRQQTKLTAADAANDDNFGVSVALLGDTAVVGSWHDDIGANADQGSVYIFVRSSAGVWNLQQKLTASDGAAGDNFGCSVAIANQSAPAQTVVMVGAFGDDIGTNANQGSVYVFVRASGGTTWSQQGKLTASDGAANDVFGNSVAISGGSAIIGANGDDIGTSVDAGSAYIFVRNGTTWEESQKLLPSLPIANDNAGWSVDISGSIAVVGDFYQGSLRGVVETYERVSGGNTWIQRDRIIGGGHFGYSVAISGETIIAGSPNLNASAPDDGAATVLTRRSDATWAVQQYLYAPDSATGDNFGNSVDISGDTVIVGAYFKNLGGSNYQGAAYVFTRSGTSWTHQQKLLDSTGAIGDRFGNSVAINGDTLVVGAYFDDLDSIGQGGSVSIFKFSNGAPFDFDGDGKTDVSVFRPSNGAWYLNQSTAGFTGVVFGQNGDLTAPADFDGDGKTDVSVFRPANGGWYRLNSSNNTFSGNIFGQNGDLPRPADFDGDGKADINVFRPSNGGWYRLNSSNGGFVGLVFGQNGDRPLIADFDGDAKSDVAVFRPSNGGWYYLQSSNGTFVGLVFGQNGDVPAVGDFDGDGKSDVSVFRPSNGGWYRFNSSNGGFVGLIFGQNGDVPTVGDYDGDGKSDVSVFRNGNWYRLNSANGAFYGEAFGISTDIPIPASFNQ